MGIIDYWHCFLAVSPLKVEIHDKVKLSDIRVICSFNIQKQGNDNEKSQGHQFVINQIYQIRKNIQHVFNYNFTESIKSKLGANNTVIYLYVFG